MSAQDRPEIRRESTDSFFDSLDKLRKTLLSETETSSSVSDFQSNHDASRLGHSPKFTLSDLEEAAADIEQFLQSQQSNPNRSEE